MSSIVPHSTASATGYSSVPQLPKQNPIESFSQFKPIDKELTVSKTAEYYQSLNSFHQPSLFFNPKLSSLFAYDMNVNFCNMFLPQQMSHSEILHTTPTATSVDIFFKKLFPTTEMSTENRQEIYYNFLKESVIYLEKLKSCDEENALQVANNILAIHTTLKKNWVICHVNFPETIQLLKTPAKIVLESESQKSFDLVEEVICNAFLLKTKDEIEADITLINRLFAKKSNQIRPTSNLKIDFACKILSNEPKGIDWCGLFEKIITVINEIPFINIKDEKFLVQMKDIYYDLFMIGLSNGATKNPEYILSFFSENLYKIPENKLSRVELKFIQFMSKIPVSMKNESFKTKCLDALNKIQCSSHKEIDTKYKKTCLTVIHSILKELSDLEYLRKNQLFNWMLVTEFCYLVTKKNLRDYDDFQLYNFWNQIIKNLDWNSHKQHHDMMFNKKNNSQNKNIQNWTEKLLSSFLLTHKKLTFDVIKNKKNTKIETLTQNVSAFFDQLVNLSNLNTLEKEKKYELDSNIYNSFLGSPQYFKIRTVFLSKPQIREDFILNMIKAQQSMQYPHTESFIKKWQDLKLK